MDYQNKAKSILKVFSDIIYLELKWEGTTMTKSIFEKMTLTQDHEEAITVATSDKYIERVRAFENKRKTRTTIRTKARSRNLRTALAQY